MKTILLVLFAFLCSSLFTVSVHAEGEAGQAQSNVSSEAVEWGAIQAALEFRNQFLNATEKKDFTQVAHQGFEAAIKELAEELRNRQDMAMADELIQNWQQTESLFFTLNMDDLGDHDPLFPWLENFFTKMTQKYGTIILTLPVVKDLRILNFAIPVVLHPKGKWQSTEVDNRIEYRKHFIPFANIVTYYSSNFACNYFAKKYGQNQLKRLCKMVSEKLEWVMGRYIAPAISDWIFKAANPALHLGKDQLIFMSVDDLRSAIYGLGY